VKLFRPAAPPHQTALAMIGAKTGGLVIVVGASEPALAAEVALVTGLNGRTLVVIPDAAHKTPLETAAANAGALIDVEIAPATSLPAADGAFDVAVLPDMSHAADRTQIVREAARVIRPGGRVVIISGRKTGGLKKLFAGSASATPEGEGILSSLANAGLRGTRLLGTADGISYFEGTRGQPSQRPQAPSRS
jgi:SAM-dependent methyltransferase